MGDIKTYTDRNGQNPLSAVALKELILGDDFFVAWYVVSTHIFKADIQPFHVRIMRNRLSSRKTLTMGFRGSGKSFVANTTYTMTHILRDPEIAIAVVTRIERQSKDFVSQLKAMFDEGGAIHEIFGDLRGDRWDALQFSLKRTTNRLECTVTACAVGSPSSLVSKHYDILIVDDIVDDKSCLTKAARDKIETTLYNSIFPAINHLSKYKYIHVIGTHYHPDDIYVRLIAKGNYKTVKIPALKLVAGVLRSIWDTVIKTAELLELQDENPLAFQQQYQQRVRKNQGSMFSAEWLQYFQKYYYRNDKLYVTVTNEDGEEIEREILRKYAGCDLAISQKTTADYFVMAIIGIDRDNNVYVLDYDRGHYTFDRQKSAIIQMNEKWRCDRVGIESVQYQAALLQEIQRTTHIPAVPIKHPPGQDKDTRFNIFSGIFETDKVFFYTKIRNLTDMIDEFLGYPDAEHDDIPDAVCIAWETAKTNPLRKSNITRDLFNI